MDANKLAVLQDDYEVFRTCALCKHGTFSPGSDWGTCNLRTYQHAKHVGEARELSINRCGGCSMFSESPQAVARLEGFAAFLVLPN